MTKDMRFEDISPFVRAAIIRSLDAGKPYQATVAYDHRIFYVLKGSGSLETGRGKRGFRI